MAQVKYDVIKAIQAWHEEIVEHIYSTLTEDTVGGETDQELAEMVFDKLLGHELLRTPEEPGPVGPPSSSAPPWHPTEVAGR